MFYIVTETEGNPASLRIFDSAAEANDAFAVIDLNRCSPSATLFEDTKAIGYAWYADGERGYTDTNGRAVEEWSSSVARPAPSYSARPYSRFQDYEEPEIV